MTERRNIVGKDKIKIVSEQMKGRKKQQQSNDGWGEMKGCQKELRT